MGTRVDGGSEGRRNPRRTIRCVRRWMNGFPSSCPLKSDGYKPELHADAAATAICVAIGIRARVVNMKVTWPAISLNPPSIILLKAGPAPATPAEAADCWVANIRPEKRNGSLLHQKMEQALVQFVGFVNDQEGHGRGDAYISLRASLSGCAPGQPGIRPEPSAADQTNMRPSVTPGAARGVFYSGMADIGSEAGDIVMKPRACRSGTTWLNKKYYLTGDVRR